MPPSGEQGLERLQQGGIDVVALDQYMPGLDGLETLERILAIPNAPPVVFVTASQDSQIAVTALKAGAADYLVKDVQGDFIPLLQVAVNGALRQAQIQRARDEAEAEVHASRDRYAALAAEREVLLREVNHRVGNSLQIIASLLHLQASSSAQDDVKAALTNAMGRVAAVAQVHRRLYTSHDLKSVLLNQYLDALLEDLRRSAEGNRMSRLTLKAEPIEIDPDRAVAIGIIVNELVMNAVKYAYPDGAGPIHVELERARRRRRAVDRRRRRRPQRQDRPALDRHGPAHRHRDGDQARRQRRARSRPIAAPGSCCGFARIQRPATKPQNGRTRLHMASAGTCVSLVRPAHPLSPANPAILAPMTSRDSASSEITPEVLLRAYACGIFPMAESADDPTPVLGRAGNARRDPARRLSHRLAAGAHRALRCLHRHRRYRVQGGDRRLRRAAGRPRRHLDQQAHPRPLCRAARARATATASRSGRTAIWSAGCTASTSAAPSSAKACFTASATPRRSRWCIWWRG